MYMNGKVNQGPLYDINVRCNRSLETKLHPVIVRQWGHLKGTFELKSSPIWHKNVFKFFKFSALDEPQRGGGGQALVQKQGQLSDGGIDKIFAGLGDHQEKTLSSESVPKARVLCTEVNFEK